MDENTPCTGRNLMDVPQDRRCGARTRAGAPCKNWSMGGRTRCHIHGGRSLCGIASPTFKHGRYSRDMVAFLLWRFGYTAHDPSAKERQRE
jgi:hypothetical protein